MAVIAYFVHGRGRGHSSRALSVMRTLLQSGHDVHLFASSQAKQLLQPSFPVQEIELAGPRASLRLLYRRFTKDRHSIRKFRSELVITDGDAPSLHAAASLSLPTLAISHGIVYSTSSIRAMPWVSRNYERFNSASSSWLAHDRVAVHFLPVQSTNARTQIARPDFPHDVVNSNSIANRDKPFFLAYLRDPSMHRVLHQAAQAGIRIVFFGQHNDTKLEKLIKTIPIDRPRFLSYLRGCQGVIASAGSNLLAECIFLRKPTLALYHRRDHEQKMNAILAERSHVAKACAIESCTPQVLASFAERANAGAFAQVPIERMMPSVSNVVRQMVARRLNTYAPKHQLTTASNRLSIR